MASWVAPEMLGRDELVLETARFVKGVFQHLIQGLGHVEPRLHTRLPRKPGEQALRFRHYGVRMHAALFEHRPDNPFLFLRQCNQKMQREQNLILPLFGNPLGLLQGLLGLLRQFIESEHWFPYKTTGRESPALTLARRSPCACYRLVTVALRNI